MPIYILKKFIDYLSKVVNAFIHRWEKKNSNPHGYALGGPKNLRLKLGLFIGLILSLLLATVFVKKGFYTPVEQNLDRETSPGAKLPTDMASGIDKNVLKNMEAKSHEVSARVDCSGILAHLRSRGTLTEREKIDFDRSCRDSVGKAMSEIIDKILTGEIPPTVATEIMQNVTAKNAEDVLHALNNEDVRKALRTDAGAVLAKNLGNLGNLSDQQLSQAVKMIRGAPPQFREDVVEAVKSAAQLENPEARQALLNTIGKARSLDEIRDIKGFADTIAKAKPDEQKVFAVAYEKAPDAATRKALSRAASEIVQLPVDDPVRGKLVQLVKQVSELPADQQKNAYNKLADVANAYRTTSDPDLKRAIGEAIMAAQSPADIIALAKRLEDLKEAEKAGPLAKDLKLAVIAGHDEDAVNKVRAAAELVRSGDIESAKKALDNKLEDEELEHILKKADEASKNPFGANNPAKSKEEISASRLKDLEGQKNSLSNRKNTLESQISQYQREGLEAGDVRLVDNYRELGQVDDQLKTLSDSIADLKIKLRQKLLELKNRTAAEFEAAGVIMPEIDIKIPDDVVANQAPDERLTNLRNINEFWSSNDGSYKKRHSKYAKFSFDDTGGVGGDAGSQVDSLLAKATKKMGDSWTIGSPGAGSQGTPSGTLEFEMSRTLHIPGVLRRIPGPISSKKVGSTTLLFEFASSVMNRKTGRVEIPVGSSAICRLKSFDNDSGRLDAACTAVDVGARDDIHVNFSLGDAEGADGVPGEIIDNRGWYLAGVFLTAFSAAVLNGVSQQYIQPIQAQASQTAAQYVTVGGATGVANILQDVAQKEVDQWQNGATFWVGYDGMLATVRQN